MLIWDEGHRRPHGPVCAYQHCRDGRAKENSTEARAKIEDKNLYHIEFSVERGSDALDRFRAHHQIESITHSYGFQPFDCFGPDARDYYELVLTDEGEAVLAKLYFENAVITEVSNVPQHLKSYEIAPNLDLPNNV